jgi:hypothetical protein
VVYRDDVSSISVRSGSNYSTSGGTIHAATSVIINENINFTNWDYDIALVQVSISFNVSIYREMCITYCCDNQLYLTLLLCKMQFF